MTGNLAVAAGAYSVIELPGVCANIWAEATLA